MLFRVSSKQGKPTTKTSYSSYYEHCRKARTSLTASSTSHQQFYTRTTLSPATFHQYLLCCTRAFSTISPTHQ